jgi:hypothetical protein
MPPHDLTIKESLQLLKVPQRTEYGYYRTTCACDACALACRHMPGYLAPADVARLYEATKADKEPLETWALRSLRASPGALVAKDGRPFRVPTIVPAVTETGACHWFVETEAPDGNKDGQCSVHAVSPFGCAFFDVHQSQMEGNNRSQQGLNDIIEDRLAKGPYSRLWQLLTDAGKTALGPEYARKRLRTAADILEQTRSKRS